MSGESDLSRGSTSVANIGAPDIGKLSSLLLSLVGENGSPNSQLYISRIEVVNMQSGIMTTFPLEAWISKDSGQTTLTAEGDPKDVFVNYQVGARPF